MLVKTYACAVQGIKAQTITVEVALSQGIKLNMVGLPDAAVRESEHRIRSTFENNNLHFPTTAIVVNLVPAGVRKEGSAFDLAIAMGLLAASHQLPEDMLDQYVIMGELSLDGSLQPIRGALPVAIQAKAEGFKGVILPAENAHEASMVDGLEVYAAPGIREVIAFLKGDEEAIKRVQCDIEEEFAIQPQYGLDFADVRGQESVKRAMEVAAAGGHNLIMVGAPGSGKTMLAKRLPTILPPLTLHEALETTKIHSVVGRMPHGRALVTERPFRAPHHTISDVALVGGGPHPQPGEISLAHNGVLFLDELPEFKRTVLEVMRQPLEERRITISRAQSTVDYPASFMLVASMNPCPCGYFNHPTKSCVCNQAAVRRYLNRISGPLLDRIDLHIEVVPVPFEKLNEAPPSDDSETIRKRVVAARAIQVERFRDTGIHCNAQMTSKHIETHCVLDEPSREMLRQAMLRLNLSARAYDRIRKVARTIADLEGLAEIQGSHVAEAIQYRALDRDGWLG